ncbi:hypothetical protein VTI74DRAFT_4600 [Chaetomium olivicolor]
MARWRGFLLPLPAVDSFVSASGFGGFFCCLRFLFSLPPVVLVLSTAGEQSPGLRLCLALRAADMARRAVSSHRTLWKMECEHVVFSNLTGQKRALRSQQPATSFAVLRVYPTAFSKLLGLFRCRRGGGKKKRAPSQLTMRSIVCSTHHVSGSATKCPRVKQRGFATWKHFGLINTSITISLNNHNNRRWQGGEVLQLTHHGCRGGSTGVVDTRLFRRTGDG